jgi:phosphatidylethanolamine-binding protein (PEBP) family uncharacterized protein
MGLAMAGCGGGSSSTSSSTRSEGASQTSSSRQTSTSTGTTGAGGKPAQSETSVTTPSRTREEHYPVKVITLTSPAVATEGAIQAAYTCDGGETSPPFHWQGVPRGAAELVLFISDVEGSKPGAELISWAVAGLKPSLTGIPAGKLPAGAVVGRNSFGKVGYTLCPAKGSPTQHYIVALYALQHPSSAQPGFAANALSTTSSHSADFSGVMGFTYTR